MPDARAVHYRFGKTVADLLFARIDGDATDACFAGGLIGWWSADGGAVAIATDFGVNEAVIGLTIVAAGTSLPEVMTSVVATWARSSQMTRWPAPRTCSARPIGAVA